MTDTVCVDIEHEVEGKCTHKVLKYLFFSGDAAKVGLHVSPLLSTYKFFCAEDSSLGFSIMSHKGYSIILTKFG